MTTETIHTCSYVCERPECIRAQRDELASRLTAQQPSVPMQQGGGEADDPLTLADVAGILGEIAEGFDGGEYAVSDETRRVLIDFASGLSDHPLFAVVGHYFAQNPVEGTAPPSAPVGVEGLPGLPCGVAVVTAKPGCAGTTAHVRIPQEAGTQLYSPQQVRDLMQQAAALAQQPAAVDEAMVERACVAHFNGMYQGGNGSGTAFTWESAPESLKAKPRQAMRAALTAAVATQHQEPTT